jgi:hypothetical protein
MRRSFAVGLVLLALSGAPALAQLAKGAAMTGPQIRASMFGIEMTGYSPTFGFAWRECIQPDGETLYETPEGLMKGRLTVSAKGEACFAYEDDGYTTPACYRMRQTDKGFRFEGEFDSLFITTKVVTGIKTCKPQDLVG